MTEHATLFSADMVLAVLREVDPKTQTRRLITARNSLVDGAGMSPKRWNAMGFDFSLAFVDDSPSPTGTPGPYLKVPAIQGRSLTMHRISPRVQPGDVLWGRETHQFDAPADGSWPATAFYGCKGAPLDLIPVRFRHPRYVLYSADWLHGQIKWRPGIHMPRWASRLELPVGRVGVERLQEISEADARAEGAEPSTFDFATPADRALLDYPLMENGNPFRNGYALLWEAINGGGTWATNPHVWVYEFSRSNA